VPPLHRLSSDRSAEHPSDSSRSGDPPAVLTAAKPFDASSDGLLSLTFSTLTCPPIRPAFRAVVHHRVLLGHSSTAWFEASFCTPAPRGPPSSSLAALKAWSFEPSFASHDLPGSWKVHPIPLPRSRTPAGSHRPRPDGRHDVAPAFGTTKAPALRPISKLNNAALVSAAYASRDMSPCPVQGSLPAGG